MGRVPTGKSADVVDGFGGRNGNRNPVLLLAAARLPTGEHAVTDQQGRDTIGDS
jgi:hypothetical protein